MERPLLTDDFVFSYTMGSEGSEPALKSFIDAVVDAGRPRTKDIQIVSPFMLADFVNGKKSILDIKALGEDGRYFNIEIQTANQKGFSNRILYYWSGLYHEQLEQGEEYEKLSPVISIVVARFNLFPANPRLHNVFTLSAENQHDCVFSDQIQIHSIELTQEKIGQLPQIHEELKNWLEFLSNGHKKTKEEMTMLTQTNSGLAVAADRYERLCRNAQLREMAIDHEKKERDLKGKLSFAREEGIQLGLEHEKGLEQGLKQGLEKGLEQGREQGREQGLEQGLKQGLEQGAVLSMRKAIVNLLTHRFPDQDVVSVNAVLEQVANEQKLNTLFSGAMECSSVEDFLKQIK